jgi:hypothetical protein
MRGLTALLLHYVYLRRNGHKSAVEYFADFSRCHLGIDLEVKSKMGNGKSAQMVCCLRMGMEISRIC